MTTIRARVGKLESALGDDDEITLEEWVHFSMGLLPADAIPSFEARFARSRMVRALAEHIAHKIGRW
jgi:hypothetical protein